MYQIIKGVDSALYSCFPVEVHFLMKFWRVIFYWVDNKGDLEMILLHWNDTLLMVRWEMVDWDFIGEMIDYTAVEEAAIEIYKLTTEGVVV